MGRHKDPKLRVKRGKKLCSKCVRMRSVDKFRKVTRNPDGLEYWCKDCEKTYNAAYQIRRMTGQPKTNRTTAFGIDSWSQIESVLRELSEMQHEINTEADLCEQRKKMIGQYAREITEPLVAHQIGLQKMLTGFLKKHLAEAQKVRKYRFGSVCFMRGKLELTLNPVLAGKLIGKP